MTSPSTHLCADADTVIRGSALAFLAHIVANARSPRAGLPPPLRVFDDPDCPNLGADTAHIHNGLAVSIENYLQYVHIKLQLDPEVMVVAMVLIERLQNESKCALLSMANLPFVVGTAVTVACKMRYDQRVFVSDFADHVCRSRRHLKRLVACEAVFLRMLGYSIWVAPATFGKYYTSLCALTRRFEKACPPPPPEPTYGSYVTLPAHVAVDELATGAQAAKRQRCSEKASSGYISAHASVDGLSQLGSQMASPLAATTSMSAYQSVDGLSRLVNAPAALRLPSTLRGANADDTLGSESVHALPPVECRSGR